MAVEDRDRNFEKALARRLRANSPGDPRAQAACADAETLAAYHERLLAPAEMNVWKEHISSCARCQEILSQLEMTDAIPVNSEEKIPAASPALHAGPVLQIAKARRASRWLWSAPAGAIAAGLLIWVTLQHKQPQLQASKTQETQVLVPLGGSRPEAASAKESPAPADELQRVSPSSRADSSDSHGRMYIQKLPSRSPAAPVPARPAEAERKDAARAQALSDARSLALDSNAGTPPKTADKKFEAKRDAPAVSAMNETVEVAAQPAQTPSSSAAPAGPPPTAQSELSSKNRQVLGGAAGQQQRKQQAQQMDGMSKFKEEGLVRLANSKASATILAPNGKVAWRVGPAGTIERSEDAGATWMIQTSGVIDDLLAGSAVSAKICWAVGKLGTILRTTDGGAHWAKLQSPIGDDFTSVFAVSAHQATVSSANGSYQTLDGGGTWKTLAPE